MRRWKSYRYNLRAEDEDKIAKLHRHFCEINEIITMVFYWVFGFVALVFLIWITSNDLWGVIL